MLSSGKLALIIALLLSSSFLRGVEISYPVSRVTYRYGIHAKEMPDLSKLGDAYISFSAESEEEFYLKALMTGTPGIFQLSDMDVFKLSEVAVHFLKQEGLEGVAAFPDPEMIDPVSGQDLRNRGNFDLTIVVWVSILDQVVFENEELFRSEGTRLKQGVNDYLFAKRSIGKPVRKELFDEVNRLTKHGSRAPRVILTASDAPGHVNAVVRIKRKQTPHFSISTANSGTPATGEWMFSMAAHTEQLTGLDDQAAFGVSISDTAERYALYGSYYIPLVSQEVLKLCTNIGFSSYDASTFGVTVMDFNGDNVFLDESLLWSPSFFNGEHWRFEMEVGLRWENVTAFNSIFSNQADVGMLTPRLAIALQTRSPYRVGLSQLSIRGNLFGIDHSTREALGGVDTTDTYSRLAVSHRETLLFGKWLGESLSGKAGGYLSRHTLSLSLKSDVALSDERHLPQHQFIIGGTGSVRGYPESPAAGDNGHQASLEYRLPFFLLSDGSRAKIPWMVSAFVDWAHTQVNAPLSYESDQTLLGMGLGLYLTMPWGLYFHADFAKPLRELKSAGIPLEGTKSSDYRIHANMGWNF